MILLFNDGGEGIDTIAKVCITADDIDACEGVGSASLSMTHRLEYPEKLFFRYGGADIYLYIAACYRDRVTVARIERMTGRRQAPDCRRCAYRNC